MHVLIAGDFYISDNFKNEPLIDQSVKELFANVDYRIVNLETPLTAKVIKNRILKTGPYLRTSAETMVPYLKQLNIDMVTLANNHILDYGVKGLADTFHILQKNKISYVGAGKNLKDASKPFTIEKDGMEIAFLNFAENEWSIAEDDKPGANPLNVIDNVNQIKAAKAIHDKVICIIHGGNENYHMPSPRMVKQYRFYVDNGADAIVGHHTHYISGYEIYKDVPIIYSLGNFLFTLQSKLKDWNTGLLAQLKINEATPVSLDVIPVQQMEKTFKTYLPQNEKRECIIRQINKINDIITNDALLQHNWLEFVQEKSIFYLNSIAPTNYFSNRHIRAILNRTGINKLCLSKNFLKYIFNLIQCEAHNDGLKYSIKKYLSKH